MSKSIFISYVYEDKEHRDKLKAWSEKKLLGENSNVTFERKDCRAQGDADIEKELDTMIQGAGVVVVLLGQNTHNHSWVIHEITLAKRKNKKCVLVRIPGTTGGKPKILNDQPEISFDVNKIRAALG